MSIFNLLLGSLMLRPYVYFFLCVYITVSIFKIGGRRTVLFLAIAWAVAFLSELSSTRIGFPFGLYHYTENTRARELFLWDVPFFDSLSFPFVAYASYSMALLFTSPMKRRGFDIQLIDTRKLQRSSKVLFLSALFFVLLDIVTDPNAVVGEKWFLGKIFHYHYQGHYFGVPLSNFAGWGFVGLAIVFIYQRCESLLDKRLGLGEYPVPGKALFGPCLYWLIIIFNITISFWIGETQLGLSSTFIMFPLLCMFLLRLYDPKAEATQEEIDNYKKDLT